MKFNSDTSITNINRSLYSLTPGHTLACAIVLNQAEMFMTFDRLQMRSTAVLVSIKQTDGSTT